MKHDGVEWHLMEGRPQYWDKERERWVVWSPGQRGPQPPPQFIGQSPNVQQEPSSWERAGERLEKVGKAMDSAGKSINGFVGSLILIGLILFVGRACGAW